MGKHSKLLKLSENDKVTIKKNENICTDAHGKNCKMNPSEHRIKVYA